ncbi:hypothetical protein [Paenibacillus sp. HB172176]|uniref:hypothetical protein n=1 Tax=Paenibacillus sp. HB172176 TaxID=2493690 RepID=UPI00143A75B6|nr:hypothetical protein [Paenibacillus sp. HB172176]
MTPKNRITYRFDHTGRVFQGEVTKEPTVFIERKTEQAAAAKVVPFNRDREPEIEREESQGEEKPWEGPVQEDIGALEQLIRDAKDTAIRTTGAGSRYVEKNEESRGFYNTEADHYPEIAYADAEQLGEGRKGPSWMQVFFSVAGALATGALFGYFILTLFTGASLWPMNPSNGSADPSNADVADAVDSGKGDSKPASATDENNDGAAAIDDAGGQTAVQVSGTVSLEAESYPYFMLQYGVFSNAEGRDLALQQLSAKGLPGAAYQTGKDYRVYAGITGDESKTAVLGSRMPGLEVYKKKIVVSTPDEFPYNGAVSDVSGFIAGTNQLIGSWVSLITAQLELTPFTPIGESATEAWQKSFETWKADFSEIKSGMSDKSGDTALTRLGSAMNGAAAAMVEYNKKASGSELWSAQTSIMNAVLIQKEWFESMSTL